MNIEEIKKISDIVNGEVNDEILRCVRNSYPKVSQRLFESKSKDDRIIALCAISSAIITALLVDEKIILKRKEYE